jgi:hypothetical protein
VRCGLLVLITNHAVDIVSECSQQSHKLSGLGTIPQSAMSTSSTGLSCTVGVSSIALREKGGVIDVI